MTIKNNEFKVWDDPMDASTESQSITAAIEQKIIYCFKCGERCVYIRNADILKIIYEGSEEV